VGVSKERGRRMEEGKGSKLKKASTDIPNQVEMIPDLQGFGFIRFLLFLGAKVIHILWIKIWSFLGLVMCSMILSPGAGQWQ
jgi:hypothetical protein